MAERAETGLMKFEDDWTGVFLRGDSAFGYLQSLRRVLDKVPEKDREMSYTILQGLMELLYASNEAFPVPTQGTYLLQEMRAYTACLKTGEKDE